MDAITQAVLDYHAAGVDMILCTGGMSVDPDDRTPGAINTPVMGLPGCVMYAKTTIFDLMLPRIAAGVRVTKQDLKKLGLGGLCLGCEVCTWPNCGFGKNG